jgi:hypothetical protein
MRLAIQKHVILMKEIACDNLKIYYQALSYIYIYDIQLIIPSMHVRVFKYLHFRKNFFYIFFNNLS